MKKTFRQHHLFQALAAYEDSRLPLDVALGIYFKHHRALGAKDRKYVAEKAYAMVRWMGLIDHFCKGSCTWDVRYRVHETLNLEQSIRDRSLPPHVRVSFPKPLFDLLDQHYGRSSANALCQISNTQAPTTVRVNLLKIDRKALFCRWKNRFELALTRRSPYGITFAKRMNFQTLEEFKQGLFEVQDEGSQLVADLVDAKPGDQVLDYCAGAGGKALAFAYKLRGKGQIYLHDIRQGALQEARRRLKRAGIENAQNLARSRPQKRALKHKMDWVLVDAPCLGSGTLRRNPDLKWKFTQERLDQIIAQQRSLFWEALSFLKPTGKIVYATCSILPMENWEQVTYFQKQWHLELAAKPLCLLPKERGMDGFFAAILKRRQR